ncbi:coenzyme F420-0:L-glutamate ligase [Oceanicoccus sagamiensis]|uniref:Coenzyme F420-0:L-glutamate ligase n=1 Tax=Oceanicoccus sagamiensis TaxID=716816 RepID=A0A1X9NIM0_9GAMM|nr:coenzyme F420-0:L-glutamate ligase [Oceanicoccus sagamiensis]ARN75339.1 coenzyme F420-0:L-glutamate ligase [Oceanicoccus sagamiensis]
MSQMTLTALPNYPMVEPGDDLAAQILSSLNDATLSLADGDVLVLAQKIVSKAENRYGYYNAVEPSEEAKKLAVEIDKDPRLVELILSESKEVVRKRPGVVVVEHRLGYVHANAGIDKSNISSDDDNPRVLLLPLDSDASARGLQQAIATLTGKTVYIIINDSAGRAWRNGTAGMAIGTAGFEPLENLIGSNDLFERPMEVTEVAVADELAAAASFMMGQAAEGAPVVHIRGAKLQAADCGSRSLIREKAKDLFR